MGFLVCNGFTGMQYVVCCLSVGIQFTYVSKRHDPNSVRAIVIDDIKMLSTVKLSVC